MCGTHARVTHARVSDARAQGSAESVSAGAQLARTGRIAATLQHAPGYANRRSVHWLWGASHKADSRVQRSYGRAVRLDDVLENRRSAEHAACAGCAPRKVSVLSHERVEARHVLVEPQDVHDRLRERGARLRTDGSSNRLDMQLFAAGRDAQSASAARGGQRRLECPCGELDAIRWQLCDSVRHDRAREVDWLAASTAKRELSKARHEVPLLERRLQVIHSPAAGTKCEHTRARQSLP